MSDEDDHTRPAKPAGCGDETMSATAHSLLSDASLFECFREGGAGESGAEIAFEALFQRHYRRVYSTLYRLVGDAAEDLVQETFLQLYTHPPRELTGDLGAWLCRVALNLGYNALRAAERQRAHRDLLARLTGGASWQPGEPDPQSSVEQRETEQQVRAALSRLSQRDASLLVLRYSGLSYTEIARTLGLAPGSVGTLLARAERAFERVYRPDVPKSESGVGDG